MPTAAGMVRVRGADITDEAFVRCRTYNHAWDEFTPIGLERPLYGWRLSLRCVRCATERHDTVDFHGGVMSRRYLWPDGYLTGRGEDKPTRTEFREELFTRLRGQLEASESVGGEVPNNVTVITTKKTAKTTASATKKTTRKRA